jgi:hypothetical protein
LTPAERRLDFQLPDFTRLSWVNEPARELWAPRIDRIIRAWAEIEWTSVLLGARACAKLRLPVDELIAGAGRWAAHGLASMPLSQEGDPGQIYCSRAAPVTPGQPILLSVAVGSLADVARFRRAWDTGDHDEIGALLGYPACCRRFFQRSWVDERSVDPTWAQACATAAPEDGATAVELGGPPAANLLWRWMGVRAVAHLPCRFDCGPTAEVAAALREVGVSAGFAQEMDWVDEILSWPVEWSALHGIAEIKTPILKISTRTDATAGKLAVRWRGSRYPEAGARGLSFPFITPARPLVTESPGFQRGLDQVIPLRSARPRWYHEDNGFSSRHGMDAQHAPIVALAREALAGVDGAVLDLGCGNGALLEKVGRGRDGLVPHGIERRAEALAHVREILPRHADRFVRASLYDPAIWSSGRRYALAILMVGRLLEGDRGRAEALRAAVLAACDRVLLYAYQGFSREPLEELAARAGLAIGPVRDGRAALVVRFG